MAGATCDGRTPYERYIQLNKVGKRSCDRFALYTRSHHVCVMRMAPDDDEFAPTGLSFPDRHSKDALPRWNLTDNGDSKATWHGVLQRAGTAMTDN